MRMTSRRRNGNDRTPEPGPGQRGTVTTLRIADGTDRPFPDSSGNNPNGRRREWPHWGPPKGPRGPNDAGAGAKHHPSPDRSPDRPRNETKNSRRGGPAGEPKEPRRKQSRKRA